MTVRTYELVAEKCRLRHINHANHAAKHLNPWKTYYSLKGNRLTSSAPIGRKGTCANVTRLIFRLRASLWRTSARTEIFKLGITVFIAVMLSTAGIAGGARAQSSGLKPEGAVRAQFGDWQVVCKPPPPGSKNETCALVQSVTAEDRNNVGLTVYFQKFPNGTKVLRVFAPVGVLLPPGLGLKIDDQDVGHAPFLRCHTFACYAQVQAPDGLVNKLKNGKTAVFIIFQTEEAGIGIPISLNGFAQALQQLK